MPQNADRKRVGDIFHDALKLPAVERPAFVHEACGGDGVLRAEVESLLAADAVAPPWMEEPVFAVACEMLACESEVEMPGRRIGPYRIERELGRGGMGAVYLAARDDGQFQQQVAVKLIRAGHDSDSIARRFREERQILADLMHPNIARLLDGGVSADDEPYLVMEYVDGMPVDDYCDQRRLPLRRRLEIFMKVCAAVQYAHRHLVLHCDLKPGNILVSHDGEVKLLDFGVARLLAAGKTREPGGEVGGPRLLTPEYASPEQFLGRQVALASDVYSLGVLLYLLLTGVSPFRRPRGSERDPASFNEEVPPPPSVAVGEHAAELSAADGGGRRDLTPERLNRRLRGDLDSIVLKALRREPSRRYGSVEQLAADLRRYLSGRPVTARRQTATYRAGKFVRRHRLAVAAAAVTTLSLLAGITVATSEAGRAEREQRKAERQRAKAEEVTDFVKALFREVDPTRARGPDLTLGEFLDDAVGPIRGGLGEQAEVQADLLQLLGDGYRRLGRLDSAQDLLRESLEIRRRALGDEHPAVARSLDGLGLLYLQQGDLAPAEAHIRRALALSRRQLGEQHADVAESLNSLGHVLLARGDPASAEPHFRRSLAIRRDVLGDRSREVSVSLNNLGVMLRDSQRPAAAREPLEEALALRRQLFGESHLLVANSLHNLAAVQADLGELEAAEQREREALAIYRQRLGDDHGSTAAALYNLARLLRLDGRIGEARDAVKEAIRINEGRQNPLPLATNLMLLGVLALGEGDFRAAEPAISRALELRRETLGVAHPEFAGSLYSLVHVLRARGAPARAAAELGAALDAWRADPPLRAWDVPYAEGRLGLALVELGRRSEAAPRLRAAVDGLRQAERNDLAAELEPALTALQRRSAEPPITSAPE